MSWAELLGVGKQVEQSALFQVSYRELSALTAADLSRLHSAAARHPVILSSLATSLELQVRVIHLIG